MTSSIFIKNGLENITNLLNNVESFCDLFDKPGTANLKSLLECPVCIGEQVFQCKNGHLLCTECLSKIKICPQCRDPMNQAARNLLAEQLVEETLPNCPFPEQGCTAKLDPSTTQQHQIDCTFRHQMPAGNTQWIATKPSPMVSSPTWRVGLAAGCSLSKIRSEYEDCGY